MEGYFIPENIASNKRILGFRRLNLAECVIEIILLFPLIAATPFTPKVRWVILGSLAAILIIVNYLGVQGHSPIQTIIHYFKYKPHANRQYSYRRFSENYEKHEAIKDGQVVSIRKTKPAAVIKDFFTT